MNEEFYTKDGNNITDAMHRLKKLLTKPLYVSGKTIDERLASYDVNALRTVFEEVKRLQKEITEPKI